MIRWLRVWYYRGLVRELELAIASEMLRAENLPATLCAWRFEMARLEMKIDRLRGNRNAHAVAALAPKDRKNTEAAEAALRG